MVDGNRETDQTRGGEPRGEINPVKVVLMFLSILIATVHQCARKYRSVCVCVCSRAIGSLGYRGE